MAGREYVVNVGVVGEPIHGVWCPHCALPSAHTAMLCIESPTGTSFQVTSHCPQCCRFDI